MLVLALVAGLLGMHTFAVQAPASAPAAGVLHAPAASSVPTAEPLVVLSGEADASPTGCGPACAEAEHPDVHVHAMAACVLALLAGLLLLVLPGSWRTAAPGLLHLAARTILPVERPRPRAPGLALLSISRT